MAKRKPLKESPSPSASTREASSTQYDTQFNPVDTTKNIVKGLGQALFNAGTGRNGGVVGVGKGAVQSFAGTASRVDDYAVRALNATGIKKATPVALQSAKRNTYGYETADLLNVLAVKAGAGKAVSKIVPESTYFVYHSGTNPMPVHITGQGSKNFHSGTLASALDRQTNVQRWVGDIPDANLSRKAYREDVAKSPSKEFFIDRYRVKSKNVENKQTYVDRAYAEIAENMDKGKALKSVKQNLGNPVQNYDNLKIPKVKSYKNLVEDPNSTSYLIPKNEIGLLKDIKFSGRATMETGYLTDRIGQGGTPSEIIRQEVGSGVNSFTTPKFINPKIGQIQSNIISATPAATIAAAFAGVAVPEKKSRAGKRIKRR